MRAHKNNNGHIKHLDFVEPETPTDRPQVGVGEIHIVW